MWGEVARQTLWGFGGCECEYNFCDMARTLRLGENAFRRPYDFSTVGWVERPRAVVLQQAREEAKPIATA